MVIKKIIWICKEADEADLYITDGEYECIAFSQPCAYHEGQILRYPLLAFVTKNLMLSYEDKVQFIKTLDSPLSYRCIAEVVDEANRLVKIGKFYLYLDANIPIGCSRGKIVEFDCGRIDAY